MSKTWREEKRAAINYREILKEGRAYRIPIIPKISLLDALIRDSENMKVTCECGADKCKTTHSHWCPKYVN